MAPVVVFVVVMAVVPLSIYLVYDGSVVSEQHHWVLHFLMLSYWMLYVWLSLVLLML